MTNFFKWLIINTSVLVLYFLLESNFSYFSKLLAGDKSGISILIYVFYVFGSLEALYQCFKAEADFTYTIEISKICTTLGLLGSILGFTIAFAALDFQEIDSGNKEAIKEMLAGISKGIPTALNTTVLGIYGSLCLLLYPLTIRGKQK